MRSMLHYALLFSVSILVPTRQTPSAHVRLGSLRGNARPLLIFASRPDDPQLEIQLRILRENAAAVAERDVVAIAVPFGGSSPTASSLATADALTVRRKFNVAPAEFTVILIGKDGGEKLRSSKPLSILKLRDTIDAMPMRQEEMRARASS